MIRGVYSAATALEAASTRQEIIAQNLAHAATPGYRARAVTFEALVSPASNGDSLAGTRPSGAVTRFDPGPVQATGNPLDLALSGPAFFVLEGPGGPVYSRNGSFVRGAGGVLQSASGLPVSGQGGPITIPDEARTITVSPEGTIRADGAELGRLRLASFADPTVLQPAGTTLFRGPAGAEPAPGTVRVEQGYREGSNVQVVEEMVAMITGLRHYEAAERALRTMSEAVAHNTRPQG